LLRNAQKRDLKKSSKTTEEEKKKTEGKKAAFFCDEPRWIFRRKGFVVFLNSPCYETPKNVIKKPITKYK
jgi:hypothetical protein